MVSDRGNRGLFSMWTCSFWVNCFISVSACKSKINRRLLEIRRFGANCSVRQYIPALHVRTFSARKLNFGEIISAPLYWRTEVFLCKWRYGSNSLRKLWIRFDLAGFFLVLAVSLFTLRTFGAQINYTVSRKILFGPHRFLSNKSPIHFAGESRKGNTFFNGKWHVQNKNGHPSPRSQTYALQL